MTTKSAFISAITTAAVAALALTGCSENRAEEAVDVAGEASLAERIAAEKPAMNEESLQDKEQELRARERELAERERRVERASSPAHVRTERVAAPAPPPPPEPVRVELAALTLIDVELLDGFSSESSAIDDAVAGVVVSDVMQNDLAVIPAGAHLAGRIVDVVQPKKIGGQARVTVLFESIELLDGSSMPLTASFVVEGKNQTGKDAGTIAGATAGGAILGNIMKDDDKDKGTLIGAAIGAAVGTTIAAKNKADPAVVAEGTVVTVQLDAPFVVEVDMEPSTNAAVGSFPRRY